MIAIETRELTKDFPLAARDRRLRAVDHLDIKVEAGSVYGLLGPNGSGKSTTIKLLLGLCRPSSGSCLLLGRQPNERALRYRIGYLPDAPYYQRFLSGIELMRFYGRLFGLSRRDREERGRALLARFGLEDAAERRIAGYSKGMLQRLGFAQALVNDPELLILDEPTAGVDPVGAAEVGRFVLDLKRQGKTVLLCSHLLDQVQEVCDRVGVMNRGRLLAEGSVQDLLGKPDPGTLLISGLEKESRQRIEELARELGGTLMPARGSLDGLFRRLVQEDESR